LTETRGERVIRFIEGFCMVPEGRLVGQPIKLLPFQRKFILDVYDNPSVTRRAYLSIARKNGKSALISCIVLAHLVGPEARRNSQIVSGARSREQAAIVFKLAAKMVRMNTELDGLVRIVPSGKKLIGLPLNVEYQAMAAEAGTAHGLSPVLAILDEVGQVRGPQDDFIDAITTAQGAHDAPLLVAISTQAPTDADLFSVWLDDARKSADPKIVCHLYAANEDADLMDESGWRAANPGYGAICSADEIRLEAERALRMPAAENTFRNLMLNQRVSVFDPFVSRAIWQQNGGEVLPFAGPVWGGLDLSITTDLTAFVLIGRDVYGDWAVEPYFWMAGDLIEERSRRDREGYVGWMRAGYIRAPSGKSIDYGDVTREIAAICAGLNVRGIAFDPYKIDLLKSHAQAQGLGLPELVEWRQVAGRMEQGVGPLEVELLHGRVRHGGNPVLTMCARNAVVKRDEQGNRKLDKAKSTGRIDGMVALAMAMGLAMNGQQTGFAPAIMVLD
jgi:phage terminase large subunit-like protein